MRYLLLLVLALAGGCGSSSAPGKLAPLGFDSRARACEVVLGERTGKIDRVAFGDGVTGRWLRQGDKVAAAFMAAGDHTIGAVQVGLSGPAASFDVLASHCYGADGQELAGASVTR
jgi:hypothetical protein